MDNCVFCKIINNQIPAEKVWEDENFLAFLSIEPINPGHILVIPKKHIDYIFDMENSELGRLFIACKPIARALKEVLKPVSGKIGIMVAGLEILHAHVSLIPINNEGDLTFSRAKRASTEELQQNTDKIKNVVKRVIETY